MTLTRKKASNDHWEIVNENHAVVAFIYRGSPFGQKYFEARLYGAPMAQYVTRSAATVREAMGYISDALGRGDDNGQ